MFKGVEAEVDDLIDKGFGEESLMKKFKKDGAKGIRQLHFKEIIKDSGKKYLDKLDQEPYAKNMPYDPSKKIEYQHMPGNVDTKPNYKKLKSERKAFGGLVGNQRKLDVDGSGDITRKDLAAVRAGHRGRAAKNSSEKSS